MAALRAGLMIRRPQPAATVAAIQRADSHGVQTAWSTVGGPTADTPTVFAAAAVQTARIGLATSIVPTYPRHPIVLSAQALALESLAPGRLRLGIGPSHRPIVEGQFGIPFEKPLEHLREYLAVLRELLWEGKADLDGVHFRVHTQLPSDIIPPRTPLLISALRAPSFRLAGEIADGAISWMCPVPYLVATARQALEAGAAAANRPVPPLVAHVPVAVGEDQAAVRAAARQQLAGYGRLPFYRRMFQDAGLPAAEDGTLTDALIDGVVVSGTPAAITARLLEIQSAGMAEILVQHVTLADPEAEETALMSLLGQAATG